MLNLVRRVQAETLGKLGKETNLITKSEIYNEVEGSINWANLIGKVGQILFFAAGVASLFFLIWGGISFITSSGEAAKKAAARNRIVYAAVGMLITAAAFALWQLTMTVAGAGDGLNPGF